MPHKYKCGLPSRGFLHLSSISLAESENLAETQNLAESESLAESETLAKSENVAVAIFAI